MPIDSVTLSDRRGFGVDPPFGVAG